MTNPSKFKIDEIKERKPSRFDYVKYDDVAIGAQDGFKAMMTEIETHINTIKSPDAKRLALIKLEECYMWIGKGIRDDQIIRNGGAELMEERKNG